MATIRVTGVQMAVGATKGDNLPKILDHIKNSDCDILIFPEMSLTGYNNEFSDTKTHEAWQQIATACRQAYVTAIIGTGARTDGHTYIQSRIYGDQGNLVGTQEKLIPTEKDREWCRPGEELRVFNIGDLDFGCLICNDLWVTPGMGPYPDHRLSYQLGQKGAQVIFHSANSGCDPFYAEFHVANLKLRARENRRHIVTVNAASFNGPINSPSGVVSPEGEWLVRCNTQGEQTFTFEIDPDTL
jgi:predicted amidohydrolase